VAAELMQPQRAIAYEQASRTWRMNVQANG
jgi:hypothetical protein